MTVAEGGGGTGGGWQGHCSYRSGGGSQGPDQE